MFRAARRRIAAFKEAFATSAGKEVLRYLAKETNAYSPTFVSSDPYQTAFNEGRRAVYNHIVAILGTDQNLLELSFKQHESLEHLQQILASRGDSE